MKGIARTTLAALLMFSIPAGSVLAAKAPPDPCKFQKTVRQGANEISIDIPEGEPCGLGTFFLTILPKKGNPQTLKAARDGMLIDVVLAELNGAAPQEIVVVAKGVDAAAYGSIAIFESIDDHWAQHRVARLSGDAANGYAGRDAFIVKDGVIERDFPVYAPAAEPTGEPQPTGEKKSLRYDFASNSWIAR
ncbi:MAG: hypothetical protein WC538_08645 [Thermoanaerobaculia bacterium]